MDLSLPIAAISRRTDAAALQVLAASGDPLTGRQVARLAERSTPSNIRLALLRLAEVGLVTAVVRHDSVLYSANRDHLVWPAVEAALRARDELIERIRALATRHASNGVTVILYGSVAHGESDDDSDVDLVVIQRDGVVNREAFIDFLRTDVRTWTGNPAQIFEATPDEVRQMHRDGDPLVEAWRVGRHISGYTLAEVLDGRI